LPAVFRADFFGEAVLRERLRDFATSVLLWKTRV
jgi:hypothetical protein